MDHARRKELHNFILTGMNSVHSLIPSVARNRRKKISTWAEKAMEQNVPINEAMLRNPTGLEFSSAE